jgi:hypothetical protein
MGIVRCVKGLAIGVLVGAALVAAPRMSAAASPQDQKVLGETHPNEALVYIVRKGEFAGSGRTERFFLNDKVAGILPNNTYAFTYAAPGTYLLWGSFHEDGVILDLVAGKTYYVVFKLSQYLALVPELEGQAAVAKAGHFREIRDDDRVKGGREAAEKWPKYQSKHASRLELGAADLAYTAPASTEGLVRVPGNTAIPAELMENLNSATVRVSDPVWLRVSGDVAVDGNLFVRKGTPIKAAVRDQKARGGFGKAGVLDIAVLSVSAVDGTLCPLAGQVAGRGVTNSINAASVLGGIIASYFVKGGESYYPAGTPLSVFTREDVWITPAGDGVPSAIADDAGMTTAVTASLSGPVACKMAQGKGPTSVEVIFQTADEVESAALVRVDGNVLPSPVPAARVGPSTAGQGASFDGWQVCRYLKALPPPTMGALESGGTGVTTKMVETPLTIRLTKKDGTSVYAQANATVTPQRR